MGQYVTQNYLKKLGLVLFEVLPHLLRDHRGFVEFSRRPGEVKSNPPWKPIAWPRSRSSPSADPQAGLATFTTPPGAQALRVLFIHTGWGDLFKQFPAQNATL